jgi:hypothetical protein
MIERERWLMAHEGSFDDGGFTFTDVKVGKSYPPNF